MSSRPHTLLLLSALWSGPALAHGQTVSQLGGRTLCLDASSVQVELEGVTAPQHRDARPQLERVLHRTLLEGLSASGVRHEVRDTCQGSAAFTQLTARVRYLDPKHYAGFGPAAYSYSVSVWVGSPQGASADLFSAFWSDLHAESRGKALFEPVVAGWGAEQVRDLAVAWHADNRPLLTRLAQAPPLWLGTVGALTGALLALGGLAAFRSLRGEAI